MFWKIVFCVLIKRMRVLLLLYGILCRHLLNHRPLVYLTLMFLCPYFCHDGLLEKGYWSHQLGLTQWYCSLSSPCMLCRTCWTSEWSSLQCIQIYNHYISSMDCSSYSLDSWAEGLVPDMDLFWEVLVILGDGYFL